MKNLSLAIFLVAIMGSISVQHISAQLSSDELRRHKEIWENEENDLPDRWGAMELLISNHYAHLYPDSALFWAEQYYNSAVEAQVRDTSYIAGALHCQYTAHVLKGEFEEAIPVIEEIIRLSQAYGNPIFEACYYTELGSAYVRGSDIEKGVDYLFRGIEILYEVGVHSLETTELVTIFYNIANVYVLLNDGESAEPYITWIDSQRPDYIGERDRATSLNIWGSLYQAMEDIPNAKKSFLQALALGEYHDPNHGWTLLGLGEVYLQENKLDSALFFLEKALPIVEKTDHHPEEVMTLGTLGKVYIKKKEFEKARDYGLRALPLAKSMNSLPHSIITATVLYQAYKGLGEPAASLEYYEMYVKAKSKSEARDVYLQLKSKEFSKILNAKEEVKSTELAQSNFEHRDRLFFLGLGFVLMLGLVVIYFQRGLMKKKKENKIIMDQIEVLKKKSNDSPKAVSKPELKTLENKTLNREKIEASIDSKLNQTDWKVLNALLNQPTITNKEIAAMLFLSVPGIRSSLQKMYRSFDISGTSGSRRIALVLAAIEISSKD